MLVKNYYDKVEEPGFLKHIIYGDSVSEETKSIVKFKDSNIEYISFKDIWNRLSLSNRIIIQNHKEYIFITDQIEIKTYDTNTDSWKLESPRYIMRHYINQNITRLNFTNCSYLDVTNDHSMIDYDSIEKTFRIKKPHEIKYVPVILSDFSISENQIDYIYSLLGSGFKNILSNTKSVDRIVPDKILNNLTDDYLKLISFIIGLWTSDRSSDGSITIPSANKNLLEQIQTLLMINGIYSHIKIDKIDDNNTIFELSTSLNKKLIEILQKLEFLKDLSEKSEFSTNYYGFRQDSDFQVCEESKYANLFQLKPIEITSSETIEYNGFVYDFSVPKTENFIANGALVHNTDSLFIVIPVKNAEKLSTAEKLKISNEVSEDINNAVTKYLNEYFLPKSNISPEQNATYFKSEMLMDSIMFLDVKKTYAYKLLAKKEKYLMNHQSNILAFKLSDQMSLNLPKIYCVKLSKILF